MWGGVKPRSHYGELFRRWSASCGLDELRRGLRHEPRPWYMAYELHQHNHLLPDRHCARLMSWCTTIVQLRRGLPAQQEAYRYAQDTFNLLVYSHKAGPATFAEYMRLCAVGKDLSGAFRWYQYWLETGRDGAGSPLQCAWLLRLALLTPSDERAEDMAAAMRQMYEAHYGGSNKAQAEETDMSMSGGAAQTDGAEMATEDAREQRELVAAFKLLAPRVHDTKLRAFLDAMPIGVQEADAVVQAGWPGKSHHHVFPHLEHGVATPRVTLRQPRLRDSLLHPDLVRSLETAAFAQDVPAVVALMQRYSDQLKCDAERQERETADAAPQTNFNCWRQAKDSTAVQFRHELLAHRDGFTAELYHYLVVALAPCRPSAALRTLQRMREAGLRILDLTRAVVLAAADGAWDEQLALFKDQLHEMATRRALDADFDISKDVELYWKYQYALFFHYRNALDEEAFYTLLLNGIGPAALQRLILAAAVHGPTCREERDLVLLDPALRRASVRYFREGCRGMAAVQAAMDAITTHMPALDLSLIAALPHFGDYALDDDDDIATDAAMLRSKLQAYDTIYLLDASFVETSEGFVELGAAPSRAEARSHGSSLVLVPYVTLAQLARSAEMAAELVTLDATLQESVRAEPRLAVERLRALYAMLRRSSHPQTSRVVRVLHFTESLLAHAVPEGTLDELGLRPETSDNDHLILLAAMLRALAPAAAQLVVCTDDPSLHHALNKGPLFAQPVTVLTTPAPATIDVRRGLVNDNPDLGYDADFCPKLDFAAAAASRHDISHSEDTSARLLDRGSCDGASRSVMDTTTTTAATAGKGSATHGTPGERADAVSPWIALLQDDNAADTTHTDVPGADRSSAAGDVVPRTPVDGAVEERVARLMELYESPHEVVPIGAKMQAASALTSVFDQFDTRDPDEADTVRDTQSRRRGQRTGPLDVDAGDVRLPRRSSTLAREALAQRGLSNKERYRLARSLSNYMGGRVPFNLRYRKVEASVLDPRNAALRALYERGIEQKRAAFKCNMHRGNSAL